VIHIVTSKTKPVALHIEMNELWAMQGGDPTPPPTIRDHSAVIARSTNRETTAAWGGGIASDGNYWLEGTQTFYYRNGSKQWESTYAAGKRVGTETYWTPDGKKKWERVFGNDGTWTWRTFDRSGKVKAESKWNGKTLVDPGSI
jgi:hypothetical protein